MGKVCTSARERVSVESRSLALNGGTRNVGGINDGRTILGALAACLLLAAVAFAPLNAQPNFDMGNSEIAVWNNTLGGAGISVRPVGLIFDENLALTHQHSGTVAGSMGQHTAWGFDGPWSFDPAAGDIDLVQDTIGCGEYEFTIGNTTFRLNLIDAKWGAGTTTSVYRILIEYDGAVKLYVRTPGTTGSWSSALTVTNWASYTYWDLISGTHDPAYLRERTTWNNKRFHVTGDDNQLPLESTNVTTAKLDVNLDVHVDVTVPDGSHLLIEGFDEGPGGDSDTELRFDNGTGLIVYGGLRTMDTRYRNEYVLFLPSSASPAPGDWSGIVCDNPAEVDLKHTAIVYAERGLDLIWAYPLYTNDVSVLYSLTDGVRMEGGSGAFHYLTAAYSHENNVNVRDVEVEFHHSQIIGSVNQNGVVCGDVSTVLLHRCHILDNAMNGIYAYAIAHVEVDSCEVYNNGFVVGQDWQGVYSFYNNRPVYLHANNVHEQAVGVGAVWGTVRGSRTDSLGRNCIHHNTYNLYGHHATFEFAKEKYDNGVLRYRGGENSVYDPYVLQGWFEFSEAWLQRDYWKGNTLFNVNSSLVKIDPALSADMAGCGFEGTPGAGAVTSTGSYTSMASTLYRSWDAISADSLRNLLYGARTLLPSSDAAAGFARVWQRSDTATARSFFERIIANSTRPEVLLPAYRYLAAIQMTAGNWSAVAPSLDAMAGYAPYGGTGYTSARAMEALARHLGGATVSARAQLDTMLQAFPGNRDLVIVDRLIGNGAVSPKAGADRRVITSEQGYALHAWPDPFTGTTSVSFELPEETVISVAVYDIAGREVRRLADGRYPGGTSTLVFDAAGLPAGTYLLRLTTGSVSKTRTLRVLR